MAPCRHRRRRHPPPPLLLPPPSCPACAESSNPPAQGGGHLCALRRIVTAHRVAAPLRLAAASRRQPPSACTIFRCGTLTAHCRTHVAAAFPAPYHFASNLHQQACPCSVVHRHTALPRLSHSSKCNAAASGHRPLWGVNRSHSHSLEEHNTAPFSQPAARRGCPSAAASAGPPPLPLGGARAGRRRGRRAGPPPVAAPRRNCWPAAPSPIAAGRRAGSRCDGGVAPPAGWHWCHRCLRRTRQPRLPPPHLCKQPQIVQHMQRHSQLRFPCSTAWQRGAASCSC